MQFESQPVLDLINMKLVLINIILINIILINIILIKHILVKHIDKTKAAVGAPRGRSGMAPPENFASQDLFAGEFREVSRNFAG